MSWRFSSGSTGGARGTDLPRRLCRRSATAGARPLPHRRPPRALGCAHPGHLGQSAPQIRLAAARAGDHDGADAHLTEARQTAARIGVDRDDYRLCFGPTNVNIWSVGLAVEMLDGTEAITRAHIFTLPPTVRALARAHKRRTDTLTNFAGWLGIKI